MNEEIKERYKSLYKHFNETMVKIPGDNYDRANDRAISFTAKHFNKTPSEIEKIIKK